MSARLFGPQGELKLGSKGRSSATLDINAFLNCGAFVPFAKWEGTYTVTSPEDLGVTSAQKALTYKTHCVRKSWPCARDIKKKEMKITKILGVAAVTSLALMASAGTASATTLEVGGVKQTGAVTFHATLESGTSLLESATGGGFGSTCTEATIHGITEVFTGFPVKGKLSATGLTFGKCTEESKVVDAPGELSFENIAGTTNATVRSIGAKWTAPSPFGTLTCTTPASPGTDIGILTGKRATSERATLDINAVLNCGFFLPSAKWEGKFEFTSPLGLGITS